MQCRLFAPCGECVNTSRSVTLCCWFWLTVLAGEVLYRYMPFFKTMPSRRGIKLSARECCMLLWLGLPPLLFFVRISVNMRWAWKMKVCVCTCANECAPAPCHWGYMLQIMYMNVKGAFQKNNAGKEWVPDSMMPSELHKLDFQQRIQVWFNTML